MLPETILQFGSGRFLRAFADLFIHQANEQGQAIGRVVVVQSTGDARAAGLNRQAGSYHVVVRGFENGAVVERVEPCGSISRAIHAPSNWEDVLAIARSADLRVVLSNTTEAGYALDSEDRPDHAPPQSFPAKLLLVLKARYEAGLPPLTVIPCELIEGNASVLKSLVLKLATEWQVAADLFEHIHQTPFLHTLVDRIVTAIPAEHPLATTDPMAIVAEPFAFWALESHPGFILEHPAVVRAADVTPYFLRKVRILNAAHTALLIRAVPRGFSIVRDAVNDPELRAWLRRLLFEEIVPALEGRVDDPTRFAEQTLERFQNPFLDHRFADIALHHQNKIRVRLVPTRHEYISKFGQEPPLLTSVIQEGMASQDTERAGN